MRDRERERERERERIKCINSEINFRYLFVLLCVFLLCVIKKTWFEREWESVHTGPLSSFSNCLGHFGHILFRIFACLINKEAIHYSEENFSLYIFQNYYLYYSDRVTILNTQNAFYSLLKAHINLLFRHPIRMR